MLHQVSSWESKVIEGPSQARESSAEWRKLVFVSGSAHHLCCAMRLILIIKYIKQILLLFILDYFYKS